MALSGTLETFSLPEVLRLLSSTKKTGLLALDGDRGHGRVWVRDGAIVAADADRAAHDQVEGVAFELLRFVDAGFDFHSGAESAEDGEPREVDDVLAEAESRLAEWRQIEAVVPSLDVWVHMVAEVDFDRTVTPAQWRVLAQVGTGASGHALAERLGEGEYDVCRQLRDLVEDGMVELDEAPAPAEMPAPVLGVDAPAATWDRPVDEPSFVEPALDSEAVSSLGADLASFVAVGTVEEPVLAEPMPEEVRHDESVHDEPVHDEPVHDEATVEPVAEVHDADVTDEIDEADDEDFLSELSQLSPKAAAAVEATWTDDATSAPEELEAEAVVEDVVPADAAAATGEDEIDQNLLLRFLSSTKH